MLVKKGERYIGILEIVPDELPYSILFLYLFYLSEKNTFLKVVELFFLLFLSLSMILTMGRGLLIITVVMFFSATLIHFISKKTIYVMYKKNIEIYISKYG